jgi:hypothetical protein
MATVLEQVPVDRIEARADTIKFGRVVLTLVLGLFFLVGKVAAKVWGLVALFAAAVQEGWADERRPKGTDPAGGA